VGGPRDLEQEQIYISQPVFFPEAPARPNPYIFVSHARFFPKMHITERPGTEQQPRGEQLQLCSPLLGTSCLEAWDLKAPSRRP
jgi:hypothetical protein